MVYHTPCPASLPSHQKVPGSGFSRETPVLSESATTSTLQTRSHILSSSGRWFCGTLGPSATVHPLTPCLRLDLPFVSKTGCLQCGPWLCIAEYTSDDPVDSSLLLTPSVSAAPHCPPVLYIIIVVLIDSSRLRSGRIVGVSHSA